MYVVKWRNKGFTVPVEVEYEDECTARLIAIQILSQETSEVVSFFPREQEHG